MSAVSRIVPPNTPTPSRDSTHEPASTVSTKPPPLAGMLATLGNNPDAPVRAEDFSEPVNDGKAANDRAPIDTPTMSATKEVSRTKVVDFVQKVVDAAMKAFLRRLTDPPPGATDAVHLLFNVDNEVASAYAQSPHVPSLPPPPFPPAYPSSVSRSPWGHTTVIQVIPTTTAFNLDFAATSQLIDSSFDDVTKQALVDHDLNEAELAMARRSIEDMKGRVQQNLRRSFS